MALDSLYLPGGDGGGPSVEAFIADAEARILAFETGHADRPIRHFIPSDHRAVGCAIRQLVEGSHLAGRGFCEWGSGFGVATGLAAQAGLDATGIEIEPELVEASRRLLRDHRLEAEILEGSYLPSGFGLYYDSVGDSRQLVADGTANPLYDARGLEVADFDLVFVYPWPGEAQMIEDLFEATAADGAVLLLYQGHADLTAYRRRA